LIAPGRLAMVMVVDTGPSIRCMTKAANGLNRELSVPAMCSRCSCGEEDVQCSRSACGKAVRYSKRFKDAKSFTPQALHLKFETARSLKLWPDR